MLVGQMGWGEGVVVKYKAVLDVVVVQVQNRVVKDVQLTYGVMTASVFGDLPLHKSGRVEEEAKEWLRGYHVGKELGDRVQKVIQRVGKEWVVKEGGLASGEHKFGDGFDVQIGIPGFDQAPADFELSQLIKALLPQSGIKGKAADLAYKSLSTV
jgi:hypothetical protein